MMDNPTLRVPQINSGFSFSIARALLLLVGLIALLGMIYLTQSSQATMTGQHALELQDKLERLRRENAQLEYEIAALTTPDKIAERARRLGLRPATITQTTFVIVKNYPVLPPKPAPRNGEPATTLPASSSVELWWSELLSRLGWLSNARAVEASP
jgi:cell division protein FtsB